MIKYFLYTTVLLLTLGQFSKIGQFGGSAVYLSDIFVGFFFLYGLIYFLTVQRSFKFSVYLLPFYLFNLIGLISLLLNYSSMNNSEFMSASFYLVRWFLYLNAASIVFNLMDQEVVSKQELFYSFVTSGVFIALAGFAQLIFLPDFSVLDPSLGWDPHKNRVASTFFDPNFTGGYLVLILTIMLFHDYFGLKPTGVLKAFFAVIFMAFFLTYSRSSWAMFGIVIFIYGLARSRMLILVSLVIAFSAYFAVPRIQTRLAGITDPADSAYFRIISWKNTMAVASDHLFLGVGFNAFKKAQIDYGFLNPDTETAHSASGSDSSFLLVLATTGIVGLAVFLLGYFLPSLTLNIFTVSIIFPLFLHSQFLNSLFFPQIMFLWLTIFSLNDYMNKKIPVPKKLKLFSLKRIKAAV